MNTVKAYLGKNNAVAFKLMQDGKPVRADIVTRAVLWVPGSAFADGNPRLADSDATEITLLDSNRQLSLQIGTLPLKPGTYICHLTVYDTVNVKGIAWATVNLQVVTWPSAV